jgi:hypothetical protein
MRLMGTPEEEGAGSLPRDDKLPSMKDRGEGLMWRPGVGRGRAGMAIGSLVFLRRKYKTIISY